MAIAKVGDVFITNSGFKAEIVEYLGAYEVKIRFSEPEECFRWCRISDLRKGKVTNFLEKVYFGVGYIGEGKHIIRSKNNTVCGSTWFHMLERCYDTRIQDSMYKTYKDCTVNEVWHCYQNFAEFYYNDQWRQEGWHLDKDLILQGNREYGPDLCAFIPRELNNLLGSSKSKRGECLIGVTRVKEKVNKQKPFYARVVDIDKVYSGYFETEVEGFMFYKENKERIIQERVKKYEGLVDPRLLESLSNWRISIDE